jgi:putative membrane protein
MGKDQSMFAKFLIPGAVTGLLLSAAVGLAPAAAQASALTSDSSFIRMAGSLGLLQQKLGKLAEERGASDVVKDFGKEMDAGYSKVNEELATAAKGAAFPKPILLREHKQQFDNFYRKSGSSFDKDYMTQAVKYQDEEVRLYEQQAKNGRVASLKKLASDRLPTIQHQLTEAKQAAGTVGADVTASTADAKPGT